jgi:hypothetical protein
LENAAMTAITFNTVQPDGDGTDSFTTGYLDGEIAAETGMDGHRATAIADMAEEHDAAYATGYYEGYWARHAVLTLTNQAAAKDETAPYLVGRTADAVMAVAL